MKSKLKLQNRQLVGIISTSIILIPILMACVKDPPPDYVPVKIHGINYSDQEFRFELEDLDDKFNAGGGEIIRRYDSSVTMCCYTLPRKWSQDLSVKINITYWNAKLSNGFVPEQHESNMTYIPKYVKPADIWVLRELDGKSSVIVSDFQPDHANWPGKTKGWPIPSLTYRREQWDENITDAELDVKTARYFLVEFHNNPHKEARKAWAWSMKENSESIRKFNGHSDKKYHEYLLNQYRTWLLRSSDNLRKLKEDRP